MHSLWKLLVWNDLNECDVLYSTWLGQSETASLSRVDATSRTDTTLLRQYTRFAGTIKGYLKVCGRVGKSVHRVCQDFVIVEKNREREKENIENVESKEISLGPNEEAVCGTTC